MACASRLTGRLHSFYEIANLERKINDEKKGCINDNCIKLMRPPKSLRDSGNPRIESLWGRVWLIDD